MPFPTTLLWDSLSLLTTCAVESDEAVGDGVDTMLSGVHGCPGENGTYGGAYGPYGAYGAYGDELLQGLAPALCASPASASRAPSRAALRCCREANRSSASSVRLFSTGRVR